MNKIIALILTFSLIFTLGCGKDDPMETLIKMIKNSSNKDELISKEELLRIQNFIEKHDILKEFSDCNKLIELAKQETKNNELKIEGCESAVKSFKTQFYIENSGSMDGYVRGNTDFEKVISKLLGDVAYLFQKENLKVNFICDKIHPKENIKELNDFVKNLEPGKGDYEIGNRNTSELNNIIKLILNNLEVDAIAIYVSDCIYSLEPGKDSKGSLSYCQNGTKIAFTDIFDKKPNVNFATSVFRLTSNFNGSYFSFNNQTKNINLERPYFVWVIGKSDLVNEFNKKINLETQYTHSFSFSENEKQPKHAILLNTNKIGTIKLDKTSNQTNFEEIEFDESKFQFTIATDLSHYKYPNDFLTDINNYSISENCKIESIKPYKKLNNNDDNKCKGMTHLITISLNKKFNSKELSLNLLNKSPKWVTELSTEDDSKIPNDNLKTFGFNYLFEGVKDAYRIRQEKITNQKNNNLFTINIKIKNIK